MQISRNLPSSISPSRPKTKRRSLERSANGHERIGNESAKDHIASRFESHSLRRVPHTSRTLRCVGFAPQFRRVRHIHCRVPQVTLGVPHSFAYFANEWARRAAPLTKLLHRTRFDPARPLVKANPDQPALSVTVGAEAAPSPLLGPFHQSALYRIAVHVAQFLDPLPLAPHIEVVEALLPNPIGS